MVAVPTDLLIARPLSTEPRPPGAVLPNFHTGMGQATHPLKDWDRNIPGNKPSRACLHPSEEVHMASKNTAVFGIYKTVAQAERAVATLTSAGFANNDISVLLSDAQSSHDFAHQKKTKAPEGTAAGAATGGVIGGTL